MVLEYLGIAAGQHMDVCVYLLPQTQYVQLIDTVIHLFGVDTATLSTSTLVRAAKTANPRAKKVGHAVVSILP
jgi:hypothetical protein